MLLDKDIEVVKSDADLPGLNAMLDNACLLEKLQGLPQFADLWQLQTDYLRYKPATSCTATLLLTFADGRQQYLFVKALTMARFAVSWQHPKRQKLVAKQDPFAPVALHDLGIILTYPQQDRALPQLGLLTPSPQRDALFRQWLPGLTGCTEISVQIMRYKPERRMLALLYRDGQPCAVLRFASVGRFEPMLTGNQWGHSTGEITLLAVVSEYRLLITEWIEGQTLCPEQGGDWQESDLFLTGRQLAGIHHDDALSSATQFAPNSTCGARNVLDTLRAICPQQEKLFVMLLDELDRRLAVHHFKPVLIHGDFSIDQVIRLPDGELRIIDWDRSALGNPASDLAAFQARIELQVIEGMLSQKQASHAMAAFHAGYTGSGDNLPPHLNEYTALAMLQLAAEPFRKRAGGWSQQIAALLLRAQQLLAIPVAVPANDALQSLLNCQRMAEPLRAALALPEASALNHIGLIADKPGRRAVLEFQFADLGSHAPFSVVGKYRCKGIHQHGYAVQQALWRNDFGANSDVAVPEPLAMLPAFHLWLQRKVSGPCMTRLLFPDNDRLFELGYCAGKALAKIQHSRTASTLVADKRWTLQDELGILWQRLAAACADRPEWAGRIIRVFSACESLALSLSRADDVFIHRDFYPAQLLVPDESPARIVVLDFDLSTRGAAALDVGNYLAHAQEQALRCWGDVRALHAHEQGFIEGRQRYGQPVAEEDIAIFTLLSLARHIGISLLFPDRHAVTERLLSLCEWRLENAFTDRKAEG
ncbi:phosphotransferase [Erwinia amylovora]